MWQTNTHTETHIHNVPCPQIHIRTQTHKHSQSHTITHQNKKRKQNENLCYFITITFPIRFETWRNLRSRTKHTQFFGQNSPKIWITLLRVCAFAKAHERLCANGHFCSIAYGVKPCNLIQVRAFFLLNMDIDLGCRTYRSFSPNQWSFSN